MREIRVSLPRGAELLFNALDDDPTPRMLSQDMLSILCPDGVSIDVGWYPAYDPTGEYAVTTLREGELDPVIEYEGRDVLKAVVVVERLAAQHCEQPVQSMSSAVCFDPIALMKDFVNTSGSQQFMGGRRAYA